MPLAAMQTVYAALLAAGQSHGIGHYGTYAANSMRLEKGYRGWGSDLTTERSPIESGLQPFLKNRDGATWKAVEARANDWEMVLIEVLSDDVYPYYAHGLWQGEHSVGIVTSAAYGHRSGKSLALAYLRDASARSDLTVDVQGWRCPVKILDRPPFDPDNARLRGQGDMT